MICICATFTAEPVQPALEFWARQLIEDWTITFAPHNQVLQTLLDPAGLFVQNRDGANVVLVRPEDLAQFEGATAAQQRDRVAELTGVLTSVKFQVPLFVALCPPYEPGLLDPLKGIPGLYLLDTSAYPVDDWRDEAAERLGRIPYTEAYFAALGTSIARLLHSLQRAPYKVIALDCDHTLWDGICGEDGPLGVTVDAPRRALQEFLLKQRDAGMVLVLASKNNPDDVLETIHAHPEMVLRWEHITNHRLSWQAKSISLREMAAELSLGADSFILLDDNPKEIGELAEGAPEVLGLTLPADPAGIPQYLEHVWAFDHPAVTASDRARAQSYEHHKRFTEAARTTPSLAHFYETLALRVDIRPIATEDLPRAAQLTQRTNQFNFTTLRRSESELLALPGVRLSGIWVADRFGDYGLTGLLITVGAEIDTFLLSCRVLGRGVEHAVARWLGENLGDTTFRVEPTPRNAPARTFFREIAGVEHGTVTLSAAELRAVEYKPVATVQLLEQTRPAKPDERLFTGYQTIALQYATVPAIVTAIRAAGQQQAPDRQVDALPVTDTEQKLAVIWAELLGQPTIGTEDNFFDLGGHSLLAVLLVARVRDAFGIELAMDDVYAADVTLGKLARLIEAQSLAGLDEAEMEALLAEIEGLTEDEVRALLQDQEGKE